MKTIKFGTTNPSLKAFALALILQLGVLSLSAAEAAKTYQVTGPIIELTDKVITVQKGDEKFEIARDPASKSDANLKVGDKVTVHYRMHVTRVETKSDKPEGKTKKK
jgi:hypothetical protein